ncbi:MAG: SLATT domain-containing protein [Mariprofundaceae bacterium]|nr:SLATT domain-containing protein [Mariprofundaceae bacterium]
MSTDLTQENDTEVTDADPMGEVDSVRETILEQRYQAKDEPISLEKELEEASVKTAYLKKQLEKSIKSYKSKHSTNTSLGVVIKFLALVFSAIVTILLGLDAAKYSDAALVISALISVVASVSAYFDFSELSLKFKETIDQLETLQVRLDYMMEGNAYIRMHEIEAVMNDYLKVLDSTQDFFQKVRHEGNGKK